MSTMSEWIGIVGFMVAAGFFAGIEMGMYSLSRLRLRFRGKTGGSSAHVLRALAADPEGFLCTTLLGTNVSYYGASALCTGMCLTYVSERYAELVATLILAPVLFVASEVVPKTLFQRHANRLMYVFVWPSAISYYVFRPFVFVLRAWTWALSAIFAKHALPSPSIFSREGLSHFLEKGREAGTLTDYQTQIAANIVGLRKRTVEKALIPMEEVVAVDVETRREDLLALARQNQMTRLPVFEGDRRNIVGVVHVFDCLWREDWQSLRELMRPTIALAKSTPVPRALLTLQHERRLMAVVTQGVGGPVVGIVTVKDLVEEIVGELGEF